MELDSLSTGVGQDLMGGWELPFQWSAGLGQPSGGGSLCHSSSGDISELRGELGGGTEL